MIVYPFQYIFVCCSHYCRVDSHHCYSEMTGVPGNYSYSLGCQEQASCLNVQQNTDPVPVGRRRNTNKALLCNQCCAEPGCNKVLCSSAGNIVISANGSCVDDPTVNCKQISSLFNICHDVHHAKTVCKHWCGLCDLVDGNWGNWTSFSKCSVTCGSGNKTRMRVCNNPSPKSGGLDCVGTNIQHTECHHGLCPVHGQWSTWQPWTACSATCGTGFTKRHRNCDSPPPDRFGQHCFGDGVDFQLCNISDCGIDGGWAAWSVWSACSGTCGVGLAIRQRACTDPPAEGQGRWCVGDTHEYNLCHHPGSCPPTLEIYSEWSQWYNCFNDIQYRNRTCYQHLDVTTTVQCNSTVKKTDYRYCGHANDLVNLF